ncbi:hypothetical protein [Thiorhodovibrio winogradskyi]|nr:hypothetical protein [Thiorhodovibrio winogradskyi]
MTLRKAAMKEPGISPQPRLAVTDKLALMPWHAWLCALEQPG